MNRNLKISLFVLFCLFSFSGIQAQKFGYLNSKAILEEMAEVKQMRSNLEALQKQLQKQGQQLLEEYQLEEKAAIDKKAKRVLSPVQEEEILAKLQEKQKTILEFEQKMQNQLLEKEQKLLKPILEKVETAINDVADEGGYQMIFDSTTGILLYANDDQDVSNLVKAKLGI